MLDKNIKRLSEKIWDKIDSSVWLSFLVVYGGFVLCVIIIKLLHDWMVK